MQWIVLLIGLFLSVSSVVAKTVESPSVIMAPQPAPTCIKTTLSSTGTIGWATVALTVTNQCSVNVDFQNSSLTFNNNLPISTSYWFQSDTLSYPIAPMQISSQALVGGLYLVTVPLQFATESWANSKLIPGKSFTVLFGVPVAGYVASSTKVWLGSAILTGEIDLTNASVQPIRVSASKATIDIVQGTQTISQVLVPWQGQFAVTGLAAGIYTIAPEGVTDDGGNRYQGSAVPQVVTVQAGQKVNATVSYQAVTLPGSIKVQVPTLPTALSGYVGKPIMTFTRVDTGSSLSQSLSWNTVNLVSGLQNNVSYQFKAPAINWNANNCIANISPAIATSSSTLPPLIHLTYACVPVLQDKVMLKVSGLPASIPKVDVTLIPSDGSTTVVQTVALTNGSGTTSILLADGVTYHVSASSVSGYVASFSPQPLLASANQTETVTFQQQLGGRVMTYIPGWKTPPTASELAAAGYTHAIIAFGVLSTTHPGEIVPAFDTITSSYIASLKQAGLKVSLSLGGALTSIANTSINFHDVLTRSQSATVFQETMVKSIEGLISQYGFDGIDIDIEQGLTAGGTFAHPTGDIAVLAAIINQLHADRPTCLISLAPQTANSAATPSFDQIWGNYASLVMQTSASLSWVGIQLYNTGCTFGIDDICYDPGKTMSPDASVANATDLLENWPAKLANGQFTGFQPYISYLKPDQVVIGYLAANSQGVADGHPVIPIATIKRALQCLRSATKGNNSCDTYVPPKTYPGFGGVFNWEVSYDKDNGYAFANGLKACVKQGVC